MTPLRQRMVEDMRVRNLSANTQRAYLQQVGAFAKHFGRSPATLGPEEEFLAKRTRIRTVPALIPVRRFRSAKNPLHYQIYNRTHVCASPPDRGVIGANRILHGAPPVRCQRGADRLFAGP
ncbi:phage integrase N-terminal SAM-like domain-containing protein [Caballeronia glathei]|uniref:phage integrase N-terminal SAM-like domain-containing protein n=1 Tax=Caballeronia glathei TaxID=60547 RepID=UPI001F45468C|nr:phage integrase N-terminal SAM-like domain-containing protein [Caballeronia glathei]